MTMDYEQLQKYQQSLLDRALNEGLRRNEEQNNTWSEYKGRHQKVIESLRTFSQELSVECMVPIGKKALMRGKLTHTNEILVSLGEGYFAKYSATQALALCNRRIKRADEILESLEKERNLYEMRQKIPECFDAFGMDERKDLIEHWDEEKLDDWRVKHREREKEYKKKLAELKSTEKQEIKTEDDLFAKLDALELQEELEAELHRLEKERPDFYTQDLGDGEAYEESEESYDESEELSDDSEGTCNKVTEKTDSSMIEKSAVSKAIPDEIREQNLKDLSTKNTIATDAIVETPKNEGTGEKRVVFGEPRVKYFDREERVAALSEETKDDTGDEDTSEDSIVRIEFKHSDNEPETLEHREDEIYTSPRDIYGTPFKPKPILRNTGPSPIGEIDNLSCDDNSTDEETNDTAGVSAYETVVRDVREYVIDKPFVNIVDTIETDEKRPVSKFKRERMKK